MRKFGKLKLLSFGRNMLIRFPLKVNENEDADALMAGMWLVEEFVRSIPEEDRQKAITIISERMRRHV